MFKALINNAIEDFKEIVSELRSLPAKSRGREKRRIRLRWGRIAICAAAAVAIIVCIIFVIVTCVSKNAQKAEALETLATDESSSETEEETTAPFERAEGVIYDGAPNEPYTDIEYVCNYAALTPSSSGYEELDTLLSNFINEHCTGDTQYERLWSGYLYLVLNSSYNATAGDSPGDYSASDPSDTPTEVLWATDFFNSGMGSCKNFAAACTFYMRALGYDAYMMTGMVPSSSGELTDHGWTICYIGGEKFIFDLQLDNNYYTRELSNGSDNPPTQINFCQPFVNVEHFYTEDSIYF